jgi:malate dehydrogenase (oxaloacetate-decarboxylating)(NADP+)
MFHHRTAPEGEMDIPVFHDDQHGTAVICAAGLINALHLSGKKIEDVPIVLNGAGAAGSPVSNC